MTNSIIFIDASIIDPQTLLSGIDPYGEIHFLNANEDGVLQISSILQERTGLGAVHIVSHGDAGSLSLGNTELNDRTLSMYQEYLWRMGASLSESGDIFLYGCNIAKGQTGLNFIQKLSQYTGADIAASNNLTGKASLGGDWNLEVQIGTVSAPQLLTAESTAVWSYTLIAPTENNDSLTGTNGDDQIDGLGGDDTIIGLDGNDTLSGGNGNDNVFGGNGNDSLADGDGADVLYGGDGNDTLNLGVGDADADRVFGDAGDDLIIFGDGQHGTNIIDGGVGTNTFQFAANAFGNFVLGNTGGTGIFSFAASGATFDQSIIGGPQIVFDASGAPGDELVVTLLDDGVNAAPSFTVGSNQTVNEDAGAQTVNDFATNISPGPADEAVQTLTFNVSNNNNALFAVQPSIDPTTGNLTYTPAANANGSTTVTVTLSDDGGGANTSGPQTFTITVNPIADTPTVTNATTNEDTQTTSGLVISRNAADGAEVTHFKITNISNGTLFLNDGVTAIANGSFITFAQANAGLKFTPTANFSGTGSFDLQSSLSNVDAGLGDSIVTASITVNAVNDAPLNTLPSAFSVDEDTNLTLTGLSITDVDAGTGNITVTLSVNSGTLAATAGGNVTVIGSGTSSIALTGNVANINAFLAGGSAPVFIPISNFNGDVTLTMVTNDQGNTGSGGVKSDTDIATITVNAVNDSPSITSGATGSVAENAPITTVVYDANATDPDTTAPNNTLSFSLNGMDAGFFTIDADDGELRLNSSANFEAKNNYSLHVIVTDEGTGNLTDTKAISISVTDVNEFTVSTPIDNNPAANTVPENAPNGTLVGITALAQDLDGTNNTVTYSLEDNAEGRFAINASSGVVSVADGTLLDFEAQDSHEIVVKALSSDGSTSFEAFEIAVLDGNDFIVGGAGNDVSYGGAQNDTLSGLGGNDILVGGVGNDSLSGGNGADLLYGESGNDTLNGGTGNDYFYGGAGNDFLYLGNDTARDRIYYTAGEGQDRIFQFNRTYDQIIFSGIPNITVRAVSGATQFRNFTSGQLLVTIEGVTGFSAADVGASKALTGATFSFL